MIKKTNNKKRERERKREVDGGGVCKRELQHKKQHTKSWQEKNEKKKKADKRIKKGNCNYREVQSSLVHTPHNREV